MFAIRWCMAGWEHVWRLGREFACIYHVFVDGTEVVRFAYGWMHARIMHEPAFIVPVVHAQPMHTHTHIHCAW